jgi:hypothetical protein
MTDGGTPIAYSALPKGAAMLTEDGRRFGTVEHVLQIPEEDLFDGIVVRTSRGLRFVDRDQIGRITSTEVQCILTDEQAAVLPEPEGNPVYDVDSLQDSGQSLHDVFGRLFRRPRWQQKTD